MYRPLYCFGLSAISALLIACSSTVPVDGITVTTFGTLTSPTGVLFYVDPASPGVDSIRLALRTAGMTESAKQSALVLVQVKADKGSMQIQMRDAGAIVFSADVRLHSAAANSADAMAAAALRGFPSRQGVRYVPI